MVLYYVLLMNINPENNYRHEYGIFQNFIHMEIKCFLAKLYLYE